MLQVGLGQPAVAGLVQVAAAGGLAVEASIPARCTERACQVSVVCGARIRRWVSYWVRGRTVSWQARTGARVQQARPGQGVQSGARKVAWTMGRPWRLMVWRQLRLAVSLGR